MACLRHHVVPVQISHRIPLSCCSQSSTGHSVNAATVFNPDGQARRSAHGEKVKPNARKGFPSPLTFCSLQSLLNPPLPTRPPSTTPQTEPKLGSANVRVPQFLADFAPTLNLLHVGLVENTRRLLLRHPSLSSTRSTDVDLPVHLHQLATQVLPLRSLDASADGLTNCAPTFVHTRWSQSVVHHIGGTDEGA